MTPFDRFLLQADSFIIMMALIVYLFKAIGRKDSNPSKSAETMNEVAAGQVKTYPVPQVKTGHTTGQAEISVDLDDQTLAVIMAAVSAASNIPLSLMKIKSVKSAETK